MGKKRSKDDAIRELKSAWYTYSLILQYDPSRASNWKQRIKELVREIDGKS
jgi:hypothetical protein